MTERLRCVVAPDARAMVSYAERVAALSWPSSAESHKVVIDGDSAYVPALDAFDNVMLGSRASIRASLFRSDRQAVGLATALGIDTLDFHPTSRGDRHLLCVARGLRQNPDLLVLASPLHHCAPGSAETILDLIEERAQAGRTTLFAVDQVGPVFEQSAHVAIVRGADTLYEGRPSDITLERARLLASRDEPAARELAEAQLRAELTGCRTDGDLADAVLRLVSDIVGNRSVMVVLSGELPTIRSVVGADGSLISPPVGQWFAVRRKGPSGQPVIDEAEVLEMGGDLGRIVLFNDAAEPSAFDIRLLMPSLETLVLARQSEVRAVQAARYINRAESVRTLVGGIAHDFNNSLQSLFGLIEVVDQANENKAIDTNLSTLRLVATDAASFVSKLVAFARTSDFQIEPVDVHDLLRDAVDIVRLGIELDLDFSFDMRAQNSVIEGDAPELRNVIVNLLLNASQAVPHTEGRITISTRCHPPSGVLSIRISDDGCGISDVALAHVFEPFVTTKGPSLGTGMGLAIAFGTIEEHEGVISIEETSPRGTTVLIEFNTSVEPESEEGELEPPPVPEVVDSGSARRVLICDDEALVLTVLSEMAQISGYDVVTANCGQQCLDIYRDQGAEIAVVLIDQLMPDIHGDQVIRELQTINPGVVVVWASGYRYVDEHVETMPKVFAQLRKPIDLHELQAVLAEATNAYQQQLRAADGLERLDSWV